MIVQCPACKELVHLVRFTAHADVVQWECSACHRSQVLRSDRAANVPPALASITSTGDTPSTSAPLPAPQTPVAAPPAVTTETPAPAEGPPAENAPTGPSPSPPAAEAAAPAALAALTPPSPPEVLPGPQEELWKAWGRVAADWGNRKAHDGFVVLCASREALPFAGSRYKEHLDGHADDALARYGRDKVLAQAMAQVTARTGDRDIVAEGRRQFYKVVGWGFIALLLVAAVIAALRSMQAMNAVGAE